MQFLSGRRVTLLMCINLCICWCKPLTVGTNLNVHLVWQQKAEYRAIPFIKRVKDFFYVSPSQQIIKGIIIRDLEHTDSTATITAGGIDFSYANIRLRSKRGESLNYQMEIYV